MNPPSICLQSPLTRLSKNIRQPPAPAPLRPITLTLGPIQTNITISSEHAQELEQRRIRMIKKKERKKNKHKVNKRKIKSKLRDKSEKQAISHEDK